MTKFSVGLNLGLAASKTALGIAGGSPSLIADGAHSASDLITDAVAYAGLHLSRRPADARHPFGHGRFESLASLGVAGVLGFVSYECMAHAVSVLLERGPTSKGLFGRVSAAEQEGAAAAAEAISQPLVELLQSASGSQALVGSMLALVVGSVVAKEWLARWCLSLGERLNSQAMVANAKHHRSDALTSVVALIGVGSNVVGAPLIDPLAAFGVSVLIARDAFSIARTSVADLTEQRLDDDESAVAVQAILDADEDVCGHRNLHVRRHGHYRIVDVDIALDRRSSLSAAQKVAATLRARCLADVPGVVDCHIHPYIDEVDVPPSAMDAGAGQGVAEPGGSAPPAAAAAPAGSETAPAGATVVRAGSDFNLGGADGRPLSSQAPIAALKRDTLDVILGTAATGTAAPAQAGVRGVLALSHDPQVHYSSMPGRGVEVQVDIVVDPAQTIGNAADIARAVERALVALEGVDHADVHLELDEGSCRQPQHARRHPPLRLPLPAPQDQ